MGMMKPEQAISRLDKVKRKVLLVMKHGLGDTVQFIIILKHIQKYRPKWIVDVVAPRGKNKCLVGFCNEVKTPGEDHIQENEYDDVHDFRWWEASMRTSEMCIGFKVPATKVLKALTEVLNINPDPDLFTYDGIKIQSSNKILVKEYLKKIPFNKYVGFHYSGLTSVDKKNVSEDLIREMCFLLNDLGFGCIIFDWEGKTSLPNKKNIFRPGKGDPIWEGQKYGSSLTIAALIEELDLFVGIDSGPLHVAGGTSTPSVGIWKEHHPIHYFDLSDNVLHILPMNSKKYIKHNYGDVRNEVELYFRKSYNHLYYKDLKKTVFQAICQQLGLSENDFVKNIIRDSDWLELRPKENLVEEYKKWTNESQQQQVIFRH